MLDSGVSTKANEVSRSVNRVFGPVLDANDGQLGFVANIDFDVLGQHCITGVIDNNRRVRERLGVNNQVQCARG